MLAYAWRNAWTLKRRLLGTAAAIMFGVALIAGTYVATDTVRGAVEGATAGPSRVVDVIVVDQRSPVTGSSVEDVDWIPDLLEAGRLTPLPADVVDELLSVEGVATVTGVVMAPVELIGRDGRVVDDHGTPIARSIDDTFAGFLARGRLPRGPDDVILDHSTAASQDLHPGDPVRVVLPDGQTQDFTLVGTVDDAEFIDNLLVGLAPDNASRLLARPGEYSLIELRAASGTDDDALRSVIDDTLGADRGAITGARLRNASRAEATQFIGLLRTVVSVAGIVALALGSFVIRNTFTIVLASRARELALLRCLGATSNLIRRLVLVEAALVGVLSSIAGLVLGIALARLLGWVIDADNVVAVPVSGVTPVVTARIVIATLLIGTVTAVASAFGAARRTTRTAPITALRDEVHAVSRREGRARTKVGVALIVAGSAAVITGHATEVGPGLMMPGVLFLTIGIVAGGPMLARAFATVVGVPLGKLFGLTGDLARVNSARNAKRTSATILPLALGLALIVAFTVFASSLKIPITHDVDVVWKADLRVTPIAHESQLAFGNQVSPDVIDRLKESDVLATVVSLQTSADYTVVGHQRTNVTGVDAAKLPDVMQITVVDGSLDEVQTGAVAISTEAAHEYQATVGDALDVDTPNGRREFVVRAIYQRPLFSAAGQEYDLIDELPYGHLLVSPADYARTTGRTGIDIVFANGDDGIGSAAVRRAVDRALEDHPATQIATHDDVVRELSSALDGAFRFYYGLLGLMTVIAFLGIANTFALSITERRREIGLLRSVGLDRRQTRTVIRLEATITAVAATAIALLLGVLLGQTFMAMQELPSAVPIRQLAVIAVAVIGIVTGITSQPARRASHLPILDAVGAE